jgi:hypothetical protein
MLIGQDAPTLIVPLLSMQSSLVTILSTGPPSVRTRSLTPAQKQNTGLLLMALQRLVGFASYSWSCTPLYFEVHLSITTMLVLSTWHPTPFNINARSMSRSIFTSSVTRPPLGKFAFCTSRWLLSSPTSSPRVYHLHSSLSFTLVYIYVVARVGIVCVWGGGVENYYHLCCIIGIWTPGSPHVWGLARPIRGPSDRHLALIRVSPRAAAGGLTAPPGDQTACLYAQPLVLGYLVGCPIYMCVYVYVYIYIYLPQCNTIIQFGQHILFYRYQCMLKEFNYICSRL